MIEKLLSLSLALLLEGDDNKHNAIRKWNQSYPFMKG
jgi:hypothetical protein